MQRKGLKERRQTGASLAVADRQLTPQEVAGIQGGQERARCHPTCAQLQLSPAQPPVWGQHGAQGRRAAREATQVGTAGTLWGDGTPRSFLAWGQDLVSARCFSSLVCWGQGHRTGCCPLNAGVRRGPCPLTPKHVLCSWGHGAGVTPSHPPLGSPVGDTKGPHMAGSPCWGGTQNRGTVPGLDDKKEGAVGLGTRQEPRTGPGRDEEAMRLGTRREPWGWGHTEGAVGCA